MSEEKLSEAGLDFKLDENVQPESGLHTQCRIAVVTNSVNPSASVCGL